VRRPIPPPRQAAPLRVDRPLPAYRYVPGLQVHPLHGGHGGSGLHEHDPPELALQRGLDLLEHRYFWEAHEALEQAWRAWRETEPERAELAAGLIQLSAAWLRRHTGHQRPAERLLSAATARLRGQSVEGLDVEVWLQATREFVASGSWP